MRDDATARVAIVGAGPAGLYAATHLLQQRDMPVHIDLFERLPTPWGLVRAGVAPDHPEKKLIADRYFNSILQASELRFFGNVEVGRDLAHTELAERYDAVIYAVGAADDCRMNIAGEDLPGSWSARQFVAFYNGHPDFSELPFDLSGRRAVVIGNGNVALDVARMLTADVAALARTDISDRALRILRDSSVSEVVVLGRRGPLQAAYHCPELEELAELDNVQICVEGADLTALDGIEDPVVRRKMRVLRQLTERTVPVARRRILFRFLRSPLRIGGAGRVERLTVACNEPVANIDGVVAIRPGGRTETIETNLVLRAVGYRGAAMPGLPFDDRNCVIANVSGRVVDRGRVVPGIYATGWIKRGCNGIIGTNKKCAAETVRLLLEDIGSGRLPLRSRPASDIDLLLRERGVRVVPARQWAAIDHAERSAGRLTGRPRVKLTSTPALLAATHPG